MRFEVLLGFGTMDHIIRSRLKNLTMKETETIDK
jgi:hypothetical protein